MSKGGVVVLVVAAIVFGVLGFVIGNVVSATVGVPGGKDDPLISQSYVDKLVADRVVELQTQIDELQGLVDAYISGGTIDTSQGQNTSTNTNDGNESTETTTPNRVKVTSNSVNIRQSSSTSSSVVGNVSAGTVLTYLGQTTTSDGVWYQVRLSNGTEGWVAGRLCGDPYHE